mgnify:CR=1 FL=1
MQKNNLLTFILISFLIFLFIIIPIRTQAARNSYEKIGNFVKDIYSSYTDSNYISIYQQIHPKIKDTFNETEYIKVHKEYFKKHDINIKECKIKNIENINELPSKFSEYITLSKSDVLLSVSIVYKATINESKKEISKKVYVLKNNKNDLFLLWDPKILNKL